MNVGAFVCSCEESCNIDLEAIRAGVDSVDVVASSEELCKSGREPMSAVIEEYDLDHVIATTPDSGCQKRIRAVSDEHDLHPDATVFVDHRERCAWVHDEVAATEKTARLIDATHAGLRTEAPSRLVSRETGDRVAVIGDPEVATALADVADVTLVADGQEFAAYEELTDVVVERGRVIDVSGSYGEFEITLEARVTDDCINCMDCVREEPGGFVTEVPVDVAPEAPDGEWTQVCPTDAIELEGVRRTIETDQVVHVDGEATARGRVVGRYTGPIDGETIATVESRLGGIQKPQFLDLEMDVCAAGESSQPGCNDCVEVCPHDAVERSAIDEVTFDEVACQNCGACTSSCPTGATRLHEPSNERICREVEALLDEDDGSWLLGGGTEGIEKPVIAFVCSEYAADRLRAYGRQAARGNDITYSPILPVDVTCTDTVGEAHVMHAIAAGADGVAIVGCGNDCLHAGPAPKVELVERLNRATSDLGLGERVGFFSPERANPETFVEEISSFVEQTLEKSPVPVGKHEATGGIDVDRPNPEFDSHGLTLESVRVILEHVDPHRDIIQGLKDFGVMNVDDSCTLTPTCTNLCPTDAIRRTTEGKLQFSHELCVNCGVCEAGCPETSITMKSGLDLTMLPENRDGDPWMTVHEDEMVECVRCGKPFASAASTEKIEREVGDLVEGIAPTAEHSVFEYCGDCRSSLLFEHETSR
ncbi:MAG: hydrogenase iron-sulfur subunit [Natronomonas sp.]